MSRVVINRNLHKDPLTNLKNYIQFIEEDFNALFGNEGYICTFKVGNLREINQVLGLETGDMTLRTAAYVISEVFGKDHLYRTEGDVFTLIVKEITYDLDQMIDEVVNYYDQLTTEKGHIDFALTTSIYYYDTPIASIEDYYMFVVAKEEHFDEGERGDQLVRHIIGGVVNRLRQSLEHYEEVYNYALIDEVSGLPNAKAANQYISRLSGNGLRCSDKYTVLFIDGDDLRRYNDVSYQTGNQMIRKIGQLIKSAIRDDDLIFRWLSGDEFLVMLEGTDNDTGEMLAERIRRKIEDQQSNFIFNTTVSIGVASYPNDGRDVDTVIYYAEKANKTAKEQGKNQVVSWCEVDISSL